MIPSPSDLNVLGKTVRARRVAVGLTLEAVAVQVGVSAGQLSRIETGKSHPSHETLVQLHRALGLESADRTVPLPRALPDDGLIARLGAVLAARRSLPLGEAATVLDASISGIQAAAVALADRLAPVGMLVIEDAEIIALVPHKSFADLAGRAAAVERMPHLTRTHTEILGIVIHAGAVTRKRIDDLRGVDSAEAVAHLVEWGLLRREGRDGNDGRAHLYRGTAKLVEVTGAASLEELRGRLRAEAAAVGDGR